MGLRILSSPDGTDTAERMRRAIEEAIAGADVEVIPVSAGHFEVSVSSELFTDKTSVQQQQLVYGAIAHLMRGDAAPIHAIDRMQTRVP